MGVASENKYGPVTSYSIKMNMSNHSTRGWVWGVSGQTPVTALNTQGNFQTKGWVKSMNRSYYFGDNQSLVGDNISILSYRSNHSTSTQFIMRDKENTIYGRLYGSGNGVNFGLLDGDGHWSYLASKDNYTAFRINNSEKVRFQSSGLVKINTTRDASSAVGSGALEIAGKLRLDGNEIITNANAALYINHDNNGNVVIDNGTLKVIAASNKITMGNVNSSPSGYKLFVEKGILSEKVRVAVKNSSDWADFVFEDEHKLLPIDELEDYVTEKKHLPNVPSAEEMVIGGLDVATMDAKLLEKIEEAHLYIIELHNEIEELKKLISDK